MHKIIVAVSLLLASCGDADISGCHPADNELLVAGTWTGTYKLERPEPTQHAIRVTTMWTDGWGLTVFVTEPQFSLLPAQINQAWIVAAGKYNPACPYFANYGHPACG